MQARDNVHQARELTCDSKQECTFYTFKSLQLEGLYVEDLVYKKSGKPLL